MTDKPILFSAPMVRALLAGKKWQTRRILKDQGLFAGKDEIVRRFPRQEGVAPISIGDRLWCRETYALVGTMDPGFVLYRASGYEAECSRHGFDKPYPPESAVKWKPSIFMNRRFSRITLLVTDIRVQRLQDISEEDMFAEGVEPFGNGTAFVKLNDAQTYSTPRACYATLWDAINGPGAWDVNPWVAAYTFVPTLDNIDADQQ